MWEEIKDSEQGICPKCKGSAIHYGSSEIKSAGQCTLSLVINVVLKGKNGII